MSASGKLLNRVRELRARLKLRQADLAAEVGVTRQTIIAIEKGRFNPSVLVSLKIARVLREPVDYVFSLAPGTEAELTAAAKVAEPKRVAKRKESTAASAKPESAPVSVEEPVEVYDKAVKAASAEPEAAQATHVEGPPVEIAAEARPAETPLSVVPPEPEMTEPAEDVESEFDEDAEPSRAESTEQPKEPVASEEPARPKGPKQDETETGQAIWDFV